MTKYTPQRIIEILEQETEDRRDGMAIITRRASAENLVAALEQAERSLTRQLLAYMVGKRRLPEAVPALLRYMEEPSESLRAEAVDALASIRQPSTGPALYARFKDAESSVPVRQLLAASLGAVGYHPAIPGLIEALYDQNNVIRGCAAWSLGALHAAEAEPILAELIEKETDGYARTRMAVALHEIRP